MILDLSRVHDIGMPIYNGMWRYREEWQNHVSSLSATSSGDASTVFRFNLCSHTGTYIETSQHKLNNTILLDQFDLADFVRPCTVVSVETAPSGIVSLDSVKATAARACVNIEDTNALIIATGWGSNHRRKEFLDACPSFSEELVGWLTKLGLGLIGVDTPIIDYQPEPFGAVETLFRSNSDLLLLAPLVVNTDAVKSGRYLLSATPLRVEAVSASLCRPLLFEME